MTAQNLHSRAMLASLNVKAWSARKYDKKVTKETNDAHNADPDAGRYNKKLLPGDAPSYKALTQHISQMRLEHYKLTLPWGDDGARVLTQMEYWHYVDTMRKMFTTADTLLDAFVDDYPTLREDARRKLNGMFNDDDYPVNIRKKYKFGIVYDPIPTGGDWRVELSEEEIAMLSASTENRVQAALAEAQADAVKRLHKVLAKMVDRLGGEEICEKCNGKGKLNDSRKNPTFGKMVTCWICEGVGEVDGVVCGQCNGFKPALNADGSKVSKVTKTEDTRPFKTNGGKVDCWICDGTGKVAGTFRDTLVENVTDLCDILSRINLADDPELEKYRKMAASLASKTNADELRDDAKVRVDVAKQAQSILDAMTSTYGASVFAPATKE